MRPNKIVPNHSAFRKLRLPPPVRGAVGPTKLDNTQTGLIEIRQLDLVLFDIRVLANGIMKTKQILNSILAVLFVFPLICTFAQQAPNSGSIEVITTFDYPGAGNSTLPQKINEKRRRRWRLHRFERGDAEPLSGSAMKDLARRSSPLTIPRVLPKDGASITHAQSTVTTSVAMVTFTGLSCRTAPSQTSMFPARSKPLCFRINDLGDFTGDFDPGSGIFQAWFSIDGTITSFSVPGALSTFAYEMTNSTELVVGYYIICLDGSGILHGHFRDADGELHFPIDPPGSVATILFGLNDRNWVVGRYADSSGVTHGLFFSPRQTASSLSIIPGQPLHRLMESMRRAFFLWSFRRCFRHPRIPGSRQRHTAGNSGGNGNEGERFPVAAHSTRSVALGVGRCEAGALS